MCFDVARFAVSRNRTRLPLVISRMFFAEISASFQSTYRHITRDISLRMSITSGLAFFFVCYSALLQRRNVFGARGTGTLKLSAKCDQRDSQRATGTVSDSNRSMPRRAARHRDRDIFQSRALFNCMHFLELVIISACTVNQRRLYFLTFFYKVHVMN